MRITPLVCPNCMSSNLNMLRSQDIQFKCNTCSYITYEPRELDTLESVKYQVKMTNNLMIEGRPQGGHHLNNGEIV